LCAGRERNVPYGTADRPGDCNDFLEAAYLPGHRSIEEKNMRNFVHAVAAHLRATTKNLTFTGRPSGKRSPASSYSWLSFPLD
jgi:hypothetical protein